MNFFSKRSGNDAIHANGDDYVNGAYSQIHITSHGSDFYFAICAAMFFSTICFAGLSYTKPRSHRIFHYLTAAITMVAAIAYFTMGSDLGQTGIQVEFPRGSQTVATRDDSLREIFYVRYIDWVVTTPLLLLDLFLTAGLPWPTILYTLLIDEIMIITGLIGALVASSYKFGYFVFGMFAFFWVAWTIVWTARKHAAALGADVNRVFLMCGCLTTFLWFLYPIAWGLSEGGNVISPDSEAVFYGILDLLAKPGFGALLIWGHRNIDPSRLGINIRDYADDLATGHPHHEKTLGNNGVTGTTHGTNGVNTGVTNGTSAV